MDIELYTDVTIIPFYLKTHYYLKSVIKLGKLEDVRGIFEPLKSGNQE